MSTETGARMVAMGDQIQAVCAESGLDVIGFTVLVKNGASLTAEVRSRVSRQEYTRALDAYISAEVMDPRSDERPS